MTEEGQLGGDASGYALPPVNRDGVSLVLADCPAEVGVHGQRMSAIAEGHEGVRNR